LDFTAKEIWTLNSPELNPLDYHVLGKCQRSLTNTVQHRRYRQTQENAANDSLSRKSFKMKTYNVSSHSNGRYQWWRSWWRATEDVFPIWQ